LRNRSQTVVECATLGSGPPAREWLRVRGCAVEALRSAEEESSGAARTTRAQLALEVLAYWHERAPHGELEALVKIGLDLTPVERGSMASAIDQLAPDFVVLDVDARPHLALAASMCATAILGLAAMAFWLRKQLRPAAT